MSKESRHHSVHPPSTVTPNLNVNKKPNVVEQAAVVTPNPNPSLGPVGLDPVNSRTPGGTTPLARTDNPDPNAYPKAPADNGDDSTDYDVDPEDPEDRLRPRGVS